MIGALISSAVKRRKVVLSITLVAALFGLLAYLNLPREAQPDITVPYVNVFVPYPGVSPEDSERLLVRPLEVQLKSVEGLKEMNAVAQAGGASITMEFPVDFDKEKVLNDVRAKVDQAKGRFPPDALEPITQEFNVNEDPVITVVLHGSAPERELYATARRLQDKLESLPGVFRADISGGREEVLEVDIDPLRMEAYGITADQIARVIQSNNQLVPAGTLETRQGSFAVKIPGVVQKPEDVLRLPIKTNGDRVVTLGDVGTVLRTFKEATSLSRLNGERSFSVGVVKRAGANILDTVKLVRKTAGEQQKTWPSSVKVDFTYDASEDINRTLVELESGLIIAVILVMIIVVWSLGIRAGLLVGAAIPTCFMLAFLMLQAMHITLNQMVMFGLVLSVGMLVDGSIVVVEYADRKMAEGHDKKEAFKLAGERMFWPVFNGIATTMCAFVPFLFWNTIPGKFMSYLPITLSFVLGASIFVALIFTPALGSVFGKHSDEHEAEIENIKKSEEGDPLTMTGFMGKYANFVWSAIRRPWLVGAVATAAVVGAITWFALTPHKIEFFLKEEPEWATIYVKARGNLSTAAMNDLVQSVENRVQNVKGVANIFARVGRQNGGIFGGPPADTIGSVRLEFVKYDKRQEMKLTGDDIVKVIRKRVEDTPGLNLEVRTPQGGPRPGKDVQIQLKSADIAGMTEASDKILAMLRANPDLTDVEDSRTSPGLEWDLAVDREAAGRYGVSVLSVGQAIQFATNGELAGRYRPDDSVDELDIRVRFPPDQRNLSTFDHLKIMTPQGAVPASYFVKRAAAPQVDSINRRDGNRLVVLQANAKPGVAANQLIAKLKPALQKAGIPASVAWKFRGADEDTADAGVFFIGAIFTILFMMAVILLWQFNSFWGVICTLFAVVLSTTGVLLGIQINLLGTFPYVSIIMAGTGVVALMGVIVGHNIVLVDTFFQVLRGGGYTSKEAALRAAVLRFRPVLLTTLTAVVGLLPLMFQIDPNFRSGHVEYKAPGSEWWVQMAGAIVWGLTFATLLTLLITPVMLGAYDGLKALFPNLGMHALKLGRRRRGAGRPAPAGPGPYVPEPAE
ncbi:MAG: efflux RND transporter permease subunit [Proteobacteria bacterium]|nr:efflux RND transporter permease subunit [Pseudomonadota bacterium]